MSIVFNVITFGAKLKKFVKSNQDTDTDRSSLVYKLQSQLNHNQIKILIFA